MNSETSTEIYRIPATAYAKIYFFRRATVMMIAIAVALGFAFEAGFDDIRWWYVIVIAMCTVVPMAISMMWFIATGRRDLPPRLHPQSVEEYQGYIKVEFYPFDYDPENPESISSVIIYDHELDRAIYGGKYVRVNLPSQKPFDFILIPTEVVTSLSIYKQ